MFFFKDTATTEIYTLSLPDALPISVAVGLGLGLFSVGTLIEAMNLARSATTGLALGAWGAVQATCAGAGIALGGAFRDGFAALAMSGDEASTAFIQGATRATGYTSVYIIEILLLLAGLAAIGPLVGRHRRTTPRFHFQNYTEFGCFVPEQP